MMQATRPRRRLPYPVRIIQAHPRLAISIAFGVAVATFFPSRGWLSTRLLLSWDAGVAL
jgi:hypothetical protein